MMQLRKSTKARKAGDTLKLLEPEGAVTNRRSKEEVAAAKEAAQHRKEEKERLRLEKEELEIAGVEKVSALENALADEDDQQEAAFPRCRFPNTAPMSKTVDLSEDDTTPAKPPSSLKAPAKKVGAKQRVAVQEQTDTEDDEDHVVAAKPKVDNSLKAPAKKAGAKQRVAVQEQTDTEDDEDHVVAAKPKVDNSLKTPAKKAGAKQYVAVQEQTDTEDDEDPKVDNCLKTPAKKASAKQRVAVQEQTDTEDDEDPVVAAKPKVDNSLKAPAKKAGAKQCVAVQEQTDTEDDEDPVVAAKPKVDNSTRSLQRTYAVANLEDAGKKPNDKADRKNSSKKVVSQVNKKKEKLTNDANQHIKPRPILKKTQGDDTTITLGREGKRDPFDKRRSYLKDSGKQAIDTEEDVDTAEEDSDVSTLEEDVTPRPKQPVKKLQMGLDDGVLELNGSDDPGWTPMDIDEKSSEDNDIDMEPNSEELEIALKNKPSKVKKATSTARSKVRGGGKTKGTHGFRDVITSKRETMKPMRKSESHVNKPALKEPRLDSGLVEDWQKKVHTQRYEARAAREDNAEDQSIQPPASINSTLSNKRARNSAVAVVSTSQPFNKKSSSHRSETNNLQTQSSFGGLEEEDDAAERDAVLSSPAKGNKRVSHSHVVRVTSPSKKKKVSDFNNDDLPAGSAHRWRHGFVTTFAYYLCCKDDPWNNSDRESFEMMQACWDFIYGKNLQYKINGIRDVVYVLGDQRWKEMRSGFASTAVNALEEHFQGIGATTNTLRRTEAERLIANVLFIYGSVKPSKTGRFLGREPFHGLLIVKTFSFFFKWTKRHDHEWEMIKNKIPIGALGLATAAVERIIRFWEKMPESAADQPAAKPFNKRKTKPVKIELTDTAANAAISGNGDNRHKISEFNLDRWSAPTRDWVALAVKAKFDSASVMQALTDKAKACVYGTEPSATSSKPVAVLDNFRRMIVMEASDSE
ncbi:hypothetical protein JOM56_009425 [Amanita muscaria]